MATHAEQKAINEAKAAARQAELLKQLDCFANSDIYGFLDFLVTAVAMGAKSNPLVHVWPPPPGQRDAGQEVIANILFGAGVAAAATGAVVSAQVQFIPLAPTLVGFIVDQGGVLFGGKPLDFGRQLPFEEMAKKEIRKAFGEERKKLIIKILTEKLGRNPTLAEATSLCRSKWVTEASLRKAAGDLPKPKVYGYDPNTSPAVQNLLQMKKNYDARQQNAFDSVEKDGVLVITPRTPDSGKKSGAAKYLMFLPLLLLL